MRRQKNAPVKEETRNRLMRLRVWRRHNENVGDYIAYTQNQYEQDPIKIRLDAAKIAKSFTKREVFVKKKIDFLDKELKDLEPERKRISALRYNKKRLGKEDKLVWRKIKSAHQRKKRYSEEIDAYSQKRTPTYWNKKIRQMGIKKEDIVGPLTQGKQQRLGAFFATS